MRTRIVHEGAGHLEYEIRQIVELARRFEQLGIPITWENIGDPIQMGERVAPWIVEKTHALLDEAPAWGYCPTRGVAETRAFLAAENNRAGGAPLAPDDILFFNGVADAVDKVYYLIRKDARVIMPSPCYPTHSSNETLRGDYEGVFFQLDPRRGWQPDLDELRAHVKYNPQIVAITITNPDNPTGMVYSRATLEGIVAIAREHRLFLICDEIYTNIRFSGAPREPLATLIGDVPTIAMRGISKEYPWPGARCAWIEVFNANRDPRFAAYVHALFLAKMMEVCSTTLPQMSIPRVMGDARWPEHLASRAAAFERRAAEAYEAFRNVPGVVVARPQGAFYFTVVFDDDALHPQQSLPVENAAARELLDSAIAGIPNDKRFCYTLLASTGICVVPLSGFACRKPGFRITLLRTDDAKRRATLERLATATRDYLAS